MRELDVTLVEWPEGRARGGPRLLGTSTDPELVAHVREQLAAERRRDLARLDPPVRLVGDHEPELEQDPDAA
jgi:hypothetical protein